MLRAKALTVSAICVALLVTGASGPIGQAAAGVSLPKRECPDVGPPQSDVGLYKIITRKMRCGPARKILRRWYHDPTQKDSGPAGWRCAVVRRRRFEFRSYCHRNGRMVAFSRYTA